MTKKEKKELALKIKAEIEAKKPKPEKTGIISREQMERNNRVRYARGKAKTMKDAKILREAKDKYMDDYNKW